MRDAAWQFTFSIAFLLVGGAILKTMAGDAWKAGDYVQGAGALATAAGVLMALHVAGLRARQAEQDRAQHLANARFMLDEADGVFARLAKKLEIKDTAVRVDVAAELRQLPMLRTGIRHYIEQPLPDASLLSELLSCLSHLHEVDAPLRNYAKTGRGGDFAAAGLAVDAAINDRKLLKQRRKAT